LLYAGFTKTRALFFNFLTGLFAILGTLVALLVGSRAEHFSLVMLPLAAGGFIYIAGSDLVPELNKEVELSKALVQLIAITIGVGLMLLLTLVE
jgi:zinc and cadmium transporter